MVRKDAGKPRRKYTRHKPWQPYHCECGAVINTTYTGKVHKMHAASTRHKHHKRLRALLSIECMTYEEIGKRLGITRERVRQLASKMGFTGEEHSARRKICTLKRREQRVAEQQARFISSLGGTRLGRFLEAAVAHGFTDNQLVTYGGNNPQRAGEFRDDIVVVGGKRIKVKPAWNYTNPNGTARFIRIASTRAQVDYIAYELPDGDGRWMFLKPWGNRRLHNTSESTCFSLNEVFKGQKGYTLNKAHHYREAIDAWHVLSNGHGGQNDVG